MKRILLAAAAVAAMTFVPHTASGQAAAELTLVHALTGSTVDVSVNGTVVIDDFLPGSLANISSFAGETLTNFTVTDSSGTVLIGPIASLDMPTSGNWSVVLHVAADGEALVSSFQNNTAVTTSNTARVTLRHVAAAPAVDLVIGSDRPIAGAVNGDSDEIELPVGQLNGAQLALAGGAAVATISTTPLAAETNTVIFAAGSVDDDTINFIVQVIDLEAPGAATTTTTAGATTTTTAAVPSAVNTGSPLDSSTNLTILAIAVGGLVVAGGAFAARRRV
jgi:hypothetical protein